MLIGHHRDHVRRLTDAAKSERLLEKRPRFGQIVHRQALIMGFSDAFAVIGVLLAVAAIAVLFARKVGAAGGGAGAH